MGDQLDMVKACALAAGEFFAEGDRRIAALDDKVGAALAGTVSPGAFFDGVMELIGELRAFRSTRVLMRAQAEEWLAAGYALRDAELQAGQQAHAEAARHGMHVVRRAAS